MTTKSTSTSKKVDLRSKTIMAATGVCLSELLFRRKIKKDNSSLVRYVLPHLSVQDEGGRSIKCLFMTFIHTWKTW